jgi:pyruvate ferredoxin oxidoreductase delta subunit
MTKKPTWRELPPGDYLAAGTAKEFFTGDWREERPILDLEKCVSCLTCWIYCPDTAVLVEDGKVKGIDYHYCKGCGICAEECPPKIKAIKMVKEEKKIGE